MNYLLFLINGIILYIAADDFRFENEFIVFLIEDKKVGACKK